MKKIITLISVLSCCIGAWGQEKIASEIFSAMKESGCTQTHELVMVAADKMLDTPYVAGTLDEFENEAVTVYLDKTDCIIFVETTLNLALTYLQKGDKASFDALVDNVRQSRYRDGVANLYSDRIHYTTEWIRQGEARGLIKDITLDLCGEVLDDPINFMTTHRSNYAHLKKIGDPVQDHDFEVIASVEKKLNEIPFTYIPEDKIPQIEGQIRSGDIICYMSATEGLDIAHVALAYVHDGVVGFIHASMGGMKVMVDPMSIAEYAASRKGITGIKVVRIL